MTHAVAAIPAEATSAAGVAVSYTAPSISDALSGVATSSCTHASGAVFPIGLTEVICTATDDQGNASSKSMIVTVWITIAPAIAPLGGTTAPTVKRWCSFL